jgi:hypothetical protein
MSEFTVYYFDEEGNEQEVVADILEITGAGNAQICNASWDDWSPLEIPMSWICKIKSVDKFF